MAQTDVVQKSGGSPKAFGQDIVTYIPQLRAYARSLCHSRDQADDLTQETLVRAWRAQKSFAPGTNMRAWLFQILRNSYYSNFRRARRQAVWSDEVAERILVSKGAQEASLELSDLHRAMATLPDEQREALILVGAGGLAYEEAAEICGCALGTIKSRVSRARRNVLRALDGMAAALGGPSRSEIAVQDLSKSFDDLLAKANGLGRFIGRPELHA